MNQINVLLADDHRVIRDGFKALLEVGGGIKVIAEAQNGAEAVQMAELLHPNVILMDITMPKLNGIEATRRILAAYPHIRIIMLSVHDDDAYVDQAIALGASGYLIKQGAANYLTTAIQAVAKGQSFFSPSIAKRLGERKGLRPAGPVKAKKCSRIGMKRALLN